MKRKTLVGDVLDSVTKYFFILIGAVVLLVLASCIRVVESGNVAVVLRFGKLVGDTREEQVREPGLHFALPYIIDEVITVPTGSVIEQDITTYYSAGKIIGNQNAGYLLTGDSNVAVVSASVKYTISDPVAYALYVKDITAIIDATVSSAMLSEAAGLEVDGLLTDKKEEFSAAVLARATESLEKLGVGVSLGTLELTHVAMPEEVRDTYEQVNAANVRAATIKEEANRYKATIVPQAREEKATRIAEAYSQKAKDEAAANHALAEFWGLLEEYKTSRDVVEARVYSDKIMQAIRRFSKVIVVEDENSKIFINP